jgi:hypothetical protein
MDSLSKLGILGNCDCYAIRFCTTALSVTKNVSVYKMEKNKILNQFHVLSTSLLLLLLWIPLALKRSEGIGKATVGGRPSPWIPSWRRRTTFWFHRPMLHGRFHWMFLPSSGQTLSISLVMSRGWLVVHKSTTTDSNYCFNYKNGHVCSCLHSELCTNIMFQKKKNHSEKFHDRLKEGTVIAAPVCRHLAALCGN